MPPRVYLSISPPTNLPTAFYLLQKLLSPNPNSIIPLQAIHSRPSRSIGAVRLSFFPMARLMWVFCVLAMWAVVHAADAPAPAVDCSPMLIQMADCLTFVENGSTIPKPTKDCCTGFKTVLKTQPSCLCESYKNSNNLGIDLNMTRAMELPKACGVSASVSNCDGLPSSVPGTAPTLSPSASSSTTPPVSSASSGGSAAARAPSPAQSDAVASSSSVLMVAVCLAVAMWTYK